MKIWAHRGASGYAPENTLEAFEMAAAMQADGVELDVQLTKDGEIAVIHDETIDRCSDGNGYVKDYTLAELKRFSFAGKADSSGRKYLLPTLREVYEVLQGTGLTVNVELKTGIFPYAGIEEKVLEESARAGMEERVIYSSFNHYSLARLKQLNPGVKTGLLYEDGWMDVPGYARQTAGADALHPSILRLEEGNLVEEAHRRGLLVHAWTINTEEEFAFCGRLGIDAVITNYPDRARTFYAGGAL